MVAAGRTVAAAIEMPLHDRATRREQMAYRQ
jgi:hypothetical protein